MVDIGAYVAQIIMDPRTLNQHVFAYTEVMSIHEMWDVMTTVTYNLSRNQVREI
jgi:hypothetical protein